MKTASFGAVQSDQRRSDERFKQQNEVFLKLVQDMRLKHDGEIKKLTEAHAKEMEKVKKAKIAAASAPNNEEIAKLKKVIEEQRERIRILEETVSKAKDLFKDA
uniref:SynN domain-containing protein n=1 Tax=Steinernema glaseri TaxID=37863 RepID=A0A1I8A3V6_9BILA